MVSAVEVITTKRDGGTLSDEQIRWFLAGYTAGDVADEQASALAMAVVWRGLDDRELATWTDAMVASGERLELGHVGRPTVDKHSTGGVGDKISLPLVPLVAACGAAVPQLSGRGLGYTGGTLDKLEAIAGWRSSWPNDEIVRLLREVGGVICAAGPSLAPADRRLYALRDVTGTVESIPLIASSIMSKKIAEGTQALVLDVKVGTGAFMHELGDARRLAETMVALGERHDVRTTAVITSMSTPLGRACGNGLEVAEALEVLHGRGPADVVELTLVLAAEMLRLTGLGGRVDAEAALADGRALDRWRAMVRAQGGDPDQPLAQAAHREVVPAPRAGWLQQLDARGVGIAAWQLGAGRARQEDAVSPTAGVVCLVKPGEAVEAGQPVLELHADDPLRFAGAREALAGAVVVGDEPPAPTPLVLDVVRA